MNRCLPAFALAAVVASAPASAADRNYTVTGFDRVRLDGPYRVRLTTGVAPFARASGSSAALDGISIEVQGQTLVIRRNPSSWGGYPGAAQGPVEITVGTHDLSTVWLNGAGSLAVNAVRGQSFDLNIQGSGSVSVGRLDVDRLRAALIGTGSASLAGKAAAATMIVRGTGALAASGLAVKDAVLGADGGAVVSANASGTAKVDAQGTASVTVEGDPACTVRALGSAVVSGCR